MKTINSNNLKLAAQDIFAGLLGWRIWLLLGWQDIKLRYRRSQIGPFWITLSMAITIYTMGFLYGSLFKMDIRHYLPFLGTGLITWALIVTTITDSTNALIESSNYLKQIKLPCVVFILRVLTRNIIIFAHNLVAFVPIIIFCHIPIGFQTLTLLISIIIIGITGLIYGLTLGMLGARFRDVNQLMLSTMQIFFFVTPIIWDPHTLEARYSFIVKFNPFAQFVDLIRAPLLGMMPTCYDYLVTISYAFFGLIFMLIVFSKARHRVVYWF